jgi:hypothetical protein
MFRSLSSEDEVFLAGMNLAVGYWSDRFSSSKIGACIENGNWVGSGKYAAHFPILRPLYRTVGSAVALGLLSHRQSGKVALTEAGQTFLDTMHKDNDDPDAIIRFMDPATMTIPASEIDRVDAWMMRFFRKMKTKVNPLCPVGWSTFLLRQFLHELAHGTLLNNASSNWTGQRT